MCDFHKSLSEILRFGRRAAVVTQAARPGRGEGWVSDQGVRGLSKRERRRRVQKRTRPTRWTSPFPAIGTAAPHRFRSKLPAPHRAISPFADSYFHHDINQYPYSIPYHPTHASSFIYLPIYPIPLQSPLPARSPHPKNSCHPNPVGLQPVRFQ
jgi:hypothetical protein